MTTKFITEDQYFELICTEEFTNVIEEIDYNTVIDDNMSINDMLQALYDVRASTLAKIDIMQHDDAQMHHLAKLILDHGF